MARRSRERMCRVRLPMHMTPGELTKALHIIGWSGRQLALRMQCASNTVTQMQRGGREIPVAVATYILALVAWHKRNPFPEPEVWRQRFDLVPKRRAWR